MFSHSHTIFYPSSEALRVAIGNGRTGGIIREETFPLTEDGLRGALNAATQTYSSPARLIIPEEYLYLTQVEVPSAEAKRDRLVQSIGAAFPETLSDLAWDFEVVSDKDGRTVVEVSGVTKEFGLLLKAALDGSRTRLEAVIPESCALARGLPTEEAFLLVHARTGGTLLLLAEDRRVVSSIVLDHRPTEAELREFIEFGQTRKQCVPKVLILSGVESKPGEFDTFGFPTVPALPPLDPIRGALLLDLSSNRDADRLDLPLRGEREPWYQRIFHHS